jgi:hypothetical protein
MIANSSPLIRSFGGCAHTHMTPTNAIPEKIINERNRFFAMPHFSSFLPSYISWVQNLRGFMTDLRSYVNNNFKALPIFPLSRRNLHFRKKFL